MNANDANTNRTSLVNPVAEPDYQTRAADRTIIAKWNIGEPDAEGGQRQARFVVTHYPSSGYRALVTTVIESHDHGYTAEQFTTSLMRMDEVITIPAKRFSQKGLEAAFDEARTELQKRFDTGESAILRHFDAAGPTPTE